MTRILILLASLLVVGCTTTETSSNQEEDSAKSVEVCESFLQSMTEEIREFQKSPDFISLKERMYIPDSFQDFTSRQKNSPKNPQPTWVQTYLYGYGKYIRITEFPNEKEQQFLKKWTCQKESQFKEFNSHCGIFLADFTAGCGGCIGEIDLFYSAGFTMMVDLSMGRITFGESASESVELLKSVSNLYSDPDLHPNQKFVIFRNLLLEKNLINSDNQPAAKRTFSCPDD